MYDFFLRLLVYKEEPKSIEVLKIWNGVTSKYNFFHHLDKKIKLRQQIKITSKKQ